MYVQGQTQPEWAKYIFYFYVDQRKEVFQDDACEVFR